MDELNSNHSIDWILATHVGGDVLLELDKPDIIPGLGSLHAVVEMVKTKTAWQYRKRESREHVRRRISVSARVVSETECL